MKISKPLLLRLVFAAIVLLAVWFILTIPRC